MDNHTLMRKSLLILCPLLLVLFFACRQEKGPLTITPLSPYVWEKPQRNTSTDSTFDTLDPQLQEDTLTARVKYFLVSGDQSDTAQLRRALLHVADTAKGPDYANFDVVQIEFYKASKKLQKDYIDSEEDLLGTYYESNFLAQVYWAHGRFLGITFYDKGNPVGIGKDVELKEIK